MEIELTPRVINGVENDTHFLYTDSQGREWSVVDFYKMMSAIPGDHLANELGYKWEAMCFAENKPEYYQFRGNTAREVVEQIESYLKTL